MKLHNIGIQKYKYLKVVIKYSVLVDVLSCIPSLHMLNMKMIYSRVTSSTSQIYVNVCFFQNLMPTTHFKQVRIRGSTRPGKLWKAQTERK